jgi:hypothetical protein
MCLVRFVHSETSIETSPLSLYKKAQVSYCAAPLFKGASKCQGTKPSTLLPSQRRMQYAVQIHDRFHVIMIRFSFPLFVFPFLHSCTTITVSFHAHLTPTMSSSQTLPLLDELVSPNAMSKFFSSESTMLSPTSAWLNFSPRTPLFNLGRPRTMADTTGRRPSTAPAVSSTNHMQVQHPRTIAAEDTEMAYPADVAVLPSPSAFANMTGPITGNMDEWVAQSIIDVQSTSNQNELEQFLSTDFYANLPDPVFDMDVFGKPATPVGDVFGMNVDPLMRFDDCSQFPGLNYMPGQVAYGQQQIGMYMPQQYPLMTPQASSSYYLQQPPHTTSNHLPHAVQSQAYSHIPVSTSSPPTPTPPAPMRKNAKKILPTYLAEAPTKPATQPHIRINTSTIGLSTRTGKINNWDPTTDGGYISLPAPQSWVDTSSGLQFSYNRWGELLAPSIAGARPASPNVSGGVTKAAAASTFTLTPSQLHTYLTSPSNPNKPTLFIQRTPADSARRYPTAHSSCCRLSACPGQLYSDRKINVGSYRVAIDERWARFGDKSDPMVVGGYVHLYCFERFLDVVALVAEGVRVVADEREFPREARGKWACRLEGREAGVAGKFLQALRTGDGEMLDRMFAGGYARHASTPEVGRKVHERMLTCVMTEAKLGVMPLSKQQLFERRGLKRSVLMVHKGDLEVYEVSKYNELVGKRGRGEMICEGDVVVDGVVVQAGRSPEVGELVEGEVVEKKRVVNKRGKKRVVEECEDEEMEDEEEYRPNSRAKKTRN